MNIAVILLIFLISALGIFVIYKIQQGSIVCLKLGQTCSGDISCCKGYTCDETNKVCTGCKQQSDCAKGYNCEVDKCVLIPDSSTCTKDADCPVDSYCPNVANSQCTKKPPDFCEVDGDCVDHYWCRNYACVTVPSGSCRSDDDCEKYQYCQNAQCFQSAYPCGNDGSCINPEETCEDGYCVVY